ncbi:MAG: coenzyme F420 hydrogenase subunit gamma, partial [Methanosphaera sp. rholeuAM74]
MFDKLKNMINTEENKDKKPIGRGTSKRLKIGYIQLSGCMGDILSFTENFDDFTDLLDSMDIVYGQTLVDVWDMPDMDVVFVEGSLCL